MGSFSIILIIAVLLVLFLIGIYNGLISKRVAAETAWAQIDVQLKRRHDLIPNLVETVKGYASHEKETLENVIKARNSAVTAGGSGSVAAQGQAEGALSGALRQIFALAESYPDLKANQSFLSLQQEVATTENMIGGSRQGYNEAVATYNTAIEQVPGNIVAGFGGFKRRDFFQMDAEELKAAQQTPKISF